MLYKYYSTKSFVKKSLTRALRREMALSIHSSGVQNKRGSRSWKVKAAMCIASTMTVKNECRVTQVRMAALSAE